MEELDSTIRRLAPQPNVTLSLLFKELPKSVQSSKGTKSLQSAFSKLLLTYKDKGHIGRLRIGILLAVLLEGKEFLEDIETKGVFLCSGIMEKKFIRMLEDLAADVHDTTNPHLKSLQSRLSTYTNLCYLTILVEGKLNRLTVLLRNRSSMLLKAALGTAELNFLNHYFEFKKDHTYSTVEAILNISVTPETFASIVSHLVAKADEVSPIEDSEFEAPIDNEIKSDELKEAIQGALVLQNLHNIAKDISCFGYILEMHKIRKKYVFKLLPPTKDFEYFLRLGHIRDDLVRNKIPVLMSDLPKYPKMSMDVLASSLIDKFPDIFMEWKEYPYPRVLVKFPAMDKIYQKFLNKKLYYEDVAYLNALRYEYGITISDIDKQFPLSKDLDMKTYLKLARTLRFASLINVNATKKHKEQHSRISYNSLIRSLNEDSLIKILSVCGATEAEIKSFLQLTSWEGHTKTFYDLQYRPLIKKGTKYMLLPGVFASSNIFRNVQVSNRLRLEDQSEKFVSLCKVLFENHFKEVVCERQVQAGGESTEIDLIVLQEKTLYLFECKYSIPPCDSHELRDIWRDIQKGIQQQCLAKKILSDPVTRQGYLSGWFPGTLFDKTKDLKIQTCVISSHRLFSGMTVRGTPIRGIHSLSLILRENEISISKIEPNTTTTIIRYSLVGEDGFSQKDLDNYLSPDSKYFKIFHQNMFAVNLFQELIPNKITLVRETFVYDMDFRKWSTQMNNLGFHRLPDKQRVLKLPLTKEKLEQFLKGRNAGE